MNKVEIYYFSGTGNSLAMARDIAARTNGKIIPVASLFDKKTVQTDADVIGIVFPVYYGVFNLYIPLIIEKFIRQLENINSKYLFAVCSYGTMPLSAINKLDNLIKTCGGRLAAGFTVKMPSNIDPAPVEKGVLFNNWKRQLEIIADTVNSNKIIELKKPDMMIKLILSPIIAFLRYSVLRKLNKFLNTSHLKIRDLIPIMDKSFQVDQNCDGCGICANICPVKNIGIIANKPSWRHHCENCLACLHWCPKESITGGTLSDLRGFKYHHPEVNISDMMR